MFLKFALFYYTYGLFCRVSTDFGKRKISKSGNGTVRKILYFPTLAVINYNKRIKTVYKRLINNHKSKKVALIAAMRKLLLIAHAIYKNKVEFSIA